MPKSRFTNLGQENFLYHYKSIIFLKLKRIIFIILFFVLFFICFSCIFANDFFILKDVGNALKPYNEINDFTNAYNSKNAPPQIQKAQNIESNDIEDIKNASVKNNKSSNASDIENINRKSQSGENIKNALEKSSNKALQNSESHDFTLLNNNCHNKNFNISKSHNIDLQFILFELARDCSFSIQYDESMKNHLDEFIYNGAIFFKNEKLSHILETLLYNFYYDISKNKIKISYKKLNLYDINYISSSRIAQSHTDVVFSQEQQNRYGSYNYGSYANYGYADSYFNNDLENSQINIEKNKLNDTNKNTNRLKDRIINSTDTLGKSGTKIYSIDEVNFWDNLQEEIGLILRKGDKLLIDKTAGLIGIWSNKKTATQVDYFLHKMYKKMITQVFLDVEIIDLMYLDSNNIGLNWQNLFNILDVGNASQSFLVNNANLNYSLNILSKDVSINTILDFLQTYGQVRSLSNPKISALNNQPAMISVGSVIRYSINTTYQASNTNNIIQNTSTNFPSVFSGILLDITPSIDNDDIILRINPSITKLKNENLENTSTALPTPPNLSTNQLSSIVRLKDGQRVVIGGLVSNYTSKSREKIPYLGNIPLIGGLFTHKVDKTSNKELIIIITPSVVKE